jgi:hypothetical protein
MGQRFEPSPSQLSQPTSGRIRGVCIVPDRDSNLLGDPLADPAGHVTGHLRRHPREWNKGEHIEGSNPRVHTSMLTKIDVISGPRREADHPLFNRSR